MNSHQANPRLLVLLITIVCWPSLTMAALKPNFVIFLSDDMGWSQVGFNGGNEVSTPNIDRIAHEGVKLTQFYVQPVCTPTRGCLLTGRYAWKNGTEVRPTVSSQHGMLGDERTLAEAMKDAGYTTWMVGKWHLGEWQHQHLPRQRGFDHHYGHYGALIDSFTHSRAGILDWHRNDKPVVEAGYSTFLFADEAAKLIREHDQKQPFFLYVPFNAVHGPHQAPQEYLRKYKDQGNRSRLLAQLECMDNAIGRVMEAITDKGIDENTLVVFTNDNGGTRICGPNGPYRGYKSHYHEGGIRVPTAIRWPGHIKAGTSTDELLHIIDLFPTFCNLAGTSLDQPLPLDGKDAWGTITDKAPSPHREIVHSLQVIRSGDWKLIDEGASYYNWTDQPLQLYNIKQDPHEKNNLAAQMPDVVKELRDRLKYYRRFARQGEQVSRIPSYPPIVYGEQENKQYGEALRKELDSIKLKQRDATIKPRTQGANRSAVPKQ